MNRKAQKHSYAEISDFINSLQNKLCKKSQRSHIQEGYD